jgi:uncharacterized protein (DUF302 family)
MTGIQAKTSLSMAEAESRLRDALKAEGFGVLTEVDVQSVLREKIGAEVEPYRILGVCNPRLAHTAMQAWKGFGLIAPCHVAIYARRARLADDGVAEGVRRRRRDALGADDLRGGVRRRTALPPVARARTAWAPRS